MPFLRLLPLIIVLPSLVISAPVKTSSYFNGNVFANVDFFKGVDVERAVKEVNGLSENAFHYVGLILVLIALATALGTLFVGIVMSNILNGIYKFFTRGQERMRKIFRRE